MVSYDDLTDEQQAAVDALDRNVTLTAGAGTGKTTTLTARYLKMIEASLEDESGTDDVLLPENILTTTFTKRAANELEASIRTEITERIASLDIEEFDAWRTVADELEHGYIHNLHGFCSRLLREHALTIDAVDPGFETLDENETTALIDDTVGDVLEDYENHETVATLARQFTRSQLHNILTDLLAERPESLEWAERWANATEDEYLAFVESELHPIDPDVAADVLAHPEFAEAARTLMDFVETPPDIDTGGRAWQRAEEVADLLDDEFDDGVPSRTKQTTIAKLSIHLTTDGDRYKDYTGAKSRWNDHPRKEEFDNAFETLVEILQPEEYAVNVDLELEANSFPFVQALAELTLIAAEEYEERKDRQNAVDFTDQISYAVEFLEDPSNEGIRERLCEQFEYVMIDEFQDTDPRQWKLIRLLTASDGETFDAENVFVVGDVKQSIYRFRNADVTQSHETAERLERVSRDRGSGDDTDEYDGDDQLSTNFRTLPDVLHSINELFESIFDEDGEPYEAAPQSLSSAREDPAEIGSVEYLAVPTDPELRAQRFEHYPEFAQAEPEHDAELEAMALAARLSQILAEPYQVYPEDAEESDEADDDDDDSPKPRDIEPSDIAILIRSRTHLKKYERALAAADVPYSVASGIGFYETTEITALLNLFRALVDPSNERALYAVLRSPLFGFTDDTLAQLKIDGDPLWEALATSEHERLQEAYESLAEWRQLAGLGGEAAAGFGGSWAAYLTRILEDTGYLVSVSAGERPQQAMANVEKFREQLASWSEDAVSSLPTLVSRIERRIDLGGRETEASTTAEGVQILTIHDAKGMEFPFVVVPGLSHEFKDEAALGNGQIEFESIGETHTAGLKAPSPDDPFKTEATIARNTIQERRRAEERAEEKRVLYVACTRARDHLLLSGVHGMGDEAEAASMTNLDEPDSESASSWRDWVQPELLTEEVLSELDSATCVDRSYGEGVYTISLPTVPVEIGQTDSETEPTTTLSPAPREPETVFRLSATALAKFLGEYGELTLDAETQTVYVEAIEADHDESPDNRHGEEDLADEAEDQVPSESDGWSDTIDPTVFGEMVHRLCELRPPESKWANVMEQTLVDEGATVDLTPELQERVSEHARRGIDYVDAQVVSSDVKQQYDELYVTAEFEHGEIAGYIDHLIITPEAYHIIDYKTGDVTREELEEDADYYLNQMKAYAIALHQQGTGRAVRVSLVFTALDDAWGVEWSIGEIEAIGDKLQAKLTTEMAFLM